MGYASLFVSFILLGLLLPSLTQAKGRAQSIQCVNNLKQIGLAMKIWALDHEDAFPFNVSTTNGGTMEVTGVIPADGFLKDAAAHFTVLSNELSVTKILVCPADSKVAAAGFADLRADNITYQLRAGPDVSDNDPQQILAICPIHQHALFSDGSVQQRAAKQLRSKQAEQP